MAAARQFPPLLRRALVGVVLLLAGCVSVERTAAPTTTAASATVTVSDRLFFGRAIPTGGEVTEAQWAAFVEEMITPRFPNGFTIYRGDGHWKGDDGASVNEKTCIVELTHPLDDASEHAIDEIAATYRKRFAQDAVLRVRTPVAMKFYRKE